MYHAPVTIFLAAVFVRADRSKNLVLKAKILGYLCKTATSHPYGHLFLI